MNPNTIILKKGEKELTPAGYKRFQKGDTIFGENSDPEEILRWPIEQKSKALDELKKYHCEYRKGREDFFVTEHALEWCVCDEDGEFLDGSDFDLADEI